MTPPGAALSMAEASSASCNGWSCSTSAGLRRQRDSGRRRRAPRPEHGTSASTRVNEPARHAGWVPSATTMVGAGPCPAYARTAPATSLARCGARSDASRRLPSRRARPVSRADLPPGPAHRSSHQPDGAGTFVRAQVTSWEPSSWTPARPSRTGRSWAGSPSQRAPKGE